MQRFFNKTSQEKFPDDVTAKSSSGKDFPFKIEGVCAVSDVTKPSRSTKDFPFQIPGISAVSDVTVKKPKPLPRPVPEAERVTEAYILEKLSITWADSRRIQNVPQGTQAWLDARKNRLTASNFGAAIGNNRYKSPNGLLRDMLWNVFRGNAATRWGSEHEDIARDAYIARVQREIDDGTSPYTSIRVEETGLFVNPARSWLGSSPDGVVHVTTRDGGSHKFLLEIKCPFRKRFYDPPVPDYYNCQIQGVMANMDLPYCDFVVWTPTGMQVTRVPFDTEFWEGTLLPGLEKFYKERYLPAIVAKANGLLAPGETTTTLNL